MYRVKEENVMVEGKEYTTYGVFYDKYFNVKDVSTDKSAVLELVKLCNKKNLDPIHLNDVVEDFLAN